MKILRVMAALACLGLGAGCGDEGAAGPDATPNPNGTRPRITVTPTPGEPEEVELFVRASGDDANDGSSAEQAFATINAALTAMAGNRGRIVVGPGDYFESIGNVPSGDEDERVVLFGNTNGDLTGDAPGSVNLTRIAPEEGSVVLVSNRDFVTIDGLTIRGARGGNNAGILIRTSTDVIVRNCEILDGEEAADGISVVTSTDVLLVNNLVARNGRRGIRVAGGNGGSAGVRLINNTVANNGGPGILIGNSEDGSEASLFFNIVQNNPLDNPVAAQILVTDPSFDLYFSDTNLVFPPNYSPEDLPQEFDLPLDALFVDELGGNYLLSDEAAGQGVTSPGIDGGFQDVFPEDLLDERDAIKARTTTTAGNPDEGEIDLGYHAPIVVPPTPTPVPRTPRAR